MPAFRGGGKPRGGGNFKRGGQREPEGPPASVVQMGSYLHSADEFLVYHSTNEDIPKFNHKVYTESKGEVGKVDEIFGTVDDVFFSVKPSFGIKAERFNKGDPIFISPTSLLPKKIFLQEPTPKPKQPKKKKGTSTGGGRGIQKGNFRGGQRGTNNRGGGNFRGGNSNRGGSGNFRGGNNNRGNRGGGGNRGRGKW